MPLSVLICGTYYFWRFRVNLKQSVRLLQTLHFQLPDHLLEAGAGPWQPRESRSEVGRPFIVLSFRTGVKNALDNYYKMHDNKKVHVFIFTRKKNLSISHFE